MEKEFPILEFDPAREAHIEPSKVLRRRDVPEHAVICFFQEVISWLVQEHGAKTIFHLKSELGKHPIYEVDYQGRRLAVYHPGIGAPLAAAMLEEVIALGSSKFIACGGAGVLDSSIPVGNVIVPISAVRDEGTSYHYLPPGREVSANPAAVAAIEKVLQHRNVPYIPAKVWTTDAIYRETPTKIKQRREEGCKAVEMEAASLMAVAQFREVIYGQLLYGGDDMGSEKWDAREWQTHSGREKLFWLAAEACLSL